MKKRCFAIAIITIIFFIFACILYLNSKWEKDSNKLMFDFIQRNREALDSYSNRYIDYDIITLERFFYIDGIDSQLPNDKYYNFVDTKKKAKLISKMILNPFYSDVLGRYYFCNVQEYKNIWIVGMFKLPMKDQNVNENYTRLGYSNLYVIISKHTSEILEIY